MSIFRKKWRQIWLLPIISKNYWGPNKFRNLIYACFQAIDWDLVKKEQKVDESVKSVEWAQPGTVHGYEMLASFVTNRIKIYNTKRNDPNVKALSNLSPWFHFGQLSVQRSVLHVKRSAGTQEAKGKIFSFKKNCNRFQKKKVKATD